MKDSGAKYAGICVFHHDGFGLHDSDVYRWCAGKMGPKRDLYGDLVRSLRDIDMRVCATFHHLRTFNWYLPSTEETIELLREKGTDLFDPAYADLYWNRYVARYDDFLKVWKAKLLEIFDKYEPDLLWFDGGKFMSKECEPYTLEVLSGYLNRALALGKEVCVLNKFNFAMENNFPLEFGVYNFENGRDRPLEVEHPWIDDAPISGHGWSYNPNVEYPKPGYFVRHLVDRVSRGGQLLLSLSPKANGELPEEEKRILREMGDWLHINGEAIYGTTRWKIPAETAMEELRYEYRPGHLRWRDDYTSEDFRFTRKDDTLYAIGLIYPKNNRILIKTLAVGNEIDIRSVQLLGYDGNISFSQKEDGLHVTLPEERPCDFAYVLQINENGGLL